MVPLSHNLPIYFPGLLKHLSVAIYMFFPQLLNKLSRLRVNLEALLWFLMELRWSNFLRRHEPVQVHLYPSPHSDQLLSHHIKSISNKAWQQEFHVALNSAANFPHHPTTNRQTDGWRQLQREGIPCCKSLGMRGQSWTHSACCKNHD